MDARVSTRRACARSIVTLYASHNANIGCCATTNAPSNHVDALSRSRREKYYRATLWLRTGFAATPAPAAGLRPQHPIWLSAILGPPPRARYLADDKIMRFNNARAALRRLFCACGVTYCLAAPLRTSLGRSQPHWTFAAPAFYGHPLLFPNIRGFTFVAEPFTGHFLALRRTAALRICVAASL